MAFRLIERLGVAGPPYRVTRYASLDAARQMARAAAFDFLIEDHCGKPIEYCVG